MMDTVAFSYGKALFQENPPQGAVEEAKRLLTEQEALFLALSNPAVTQTEKERVIARFFDPALYNFLAVVCKNRQLDAIWDIFAAYDALILAQENGISAEFICTVAPDEEQTAKIRRMLLEKYQKEKVVLHMKIDPSILGGCILECNGVTYDKSVRGALRALQKKLSGR